MPSYNDDYRPTDCVVHSKDFCRLQKKTDHDSKKHSDIDFIGALYLDSLSSK
jgi:hypothetical protein